MDRTHAQQDPEHDWKRFEAELRRAVPGSAYGIWLGGLRPVGVEGDAFVVSVPDERHALVAARFQRVLGACASATLGPGFHVEIVRESTASQPSPAATGPAGGEAFNPKYTFDQFVIGAGNRFAHAAALAVAELPAQAYNPLFIYGRPGLGKTHLLHSIGHYVTTYGGGLTVRYTTVEAFTNTFIGAIQGGTMDRFKQRYRDCDVLLIDDVQFLRSKARTEEEFFHTFNAVYESGAQLVLTSDRLPRDLVDVEDRLRERFEAGLVTSIQPPEFGTRLTILRKRARHDGVEVAEEEALELIAARVTENVRSLEGALIRVVAFQSLTGRRIDCELVGEVLDGLYPQASTQPGRTVGEVQQATCEAFGVSLEELLSSSREARLTLPRQIAMYLSRELTDSTLPAIARQFGGRNHTTVMHACRRVGERIAVDPDAYEAVQELSRRLRERS